MAGLDFRFVLGAVRALSLWVLRAVVSAFGMALGTIADWWRGVPHRVREFADQWKERVGGSIPSAYTEYFYYAACVVALFAIVLIWIIASYATVWLIESLIR